MINCYNNHLFVVTPAAAEGFTNKVVYAPSFLATACCNNGGTFKSVAGVVVIVMCTIIIT